MKKLVTLILVLAGIVGTASATTTRLFIYMVDNWKTYSGGTKIYTWDTSGNKYTGEYNSEDNRMTQIGSTNWYYIDADFPETINMILISGNGDSWKSANIENVTIKDKYLMFSSDGNGTVFSYTTHDMGYYLYKADGTKTAMTSTDGNTFTATLNNQTSPGNGEYFMVPYFAIDNYGSSDDRWYYMLRPWNEHQILSFKNASNRNCGYFKALDGENSNSWKTNYVPAYFEFTLDAENDSYSIAPYFTRTINPSIGYATFSSTYDVAVDGATAYYCTGIDGGQLSISEFSDGIPADQGALLEGSGEVTFTPAASALSAPGTNWLKPGTGATVPQTDGSGNTNFILTNKTVSGSADLKFYKVNSDGNTVATGKAYLQIPSTYVGAHEYFWFEDETTGIEAAKASQKMNGEFFNLAGQRVAQPTKGLYIVNGKKVIIK